MISSQPTGGITAAQQRMLEEVLGWGQERPALPPGLLGALQARLRASVRVPRSDPDAVSLHLGAILRADAAGGTPLHHDRDTVRGILLARAFARDVDARHSDPLDRLVARLADELAGERPGDPSSASAWLNAAGADTITHLRQELVGVLTDIRSLWPVLDQVHLQVQVRPALRVEVAPGPTVVTARPDLVLDSNRVDDRARSLVVVTRTGMPRPREDQRRARATALLSALATGRVPFRWVTLHLTDGRAEWEDLDHDILLDTAQHVGERVSQLLAQGRPPDRPTAEERR